MPLPRRLCVLSWAGRSISTARPPRRRKAFPEVPVELEDERFTSVLAHRAMIDGGMKKSDRRDKASVDKISAAIILQSYLDKKK